MLSSISESIVFGGASLSGEGGGYGFGAITESDSSKLIRAALEIGVTWFDTAPIYGFGLSEERLGRYLTPDAKVITKGGVSWHSNKRVNMSNAPAIIQSMIEDSLKRLDRHIDVYMIHWPDPKVDIRKALEPIIRYQNLGYISKIGLANTNPDDLKKAQELVKIEYVQIEGSYLSQGPIDQIRSYLQAHMLTQSWGTLAKGILTGRVTLDRKFDSYDARSWAPWWKKQNLSVLIERAKVFLNVSNQFQVKPMILAVAYNLSYLKFNQAIVGFKTVSDINQLYDLHSSNQQVRNALSFLTTQQTSSTIE
jgi:aryl-alcohol dehydrogenase-like predicted oxidoreductase